MKNSMLKAIASLACAATLAACGGAYKDPAAAPLPPQPAFEKKDTATGNGTATVASGDLVTFFATGYVYDDTKPPENKGAQFEARTSAPRAITVGVGSVIAGLDQGLVGMKAGGKRTVKIPSSMAFGPSEFKDAAGKVLVPANTAVVYDIEVVSFTTVPSPIPPQPVFTKTDNTVGTGVEAAANNLVGVHYTGYLYDDTKTDKKGAQIETSRNGSPFNFLLGVNSRIIGWEQGVLGMKIGGKRTVMIPASLAWGPQGRQDNTGKYIVAPNTAVVYEFELMTVVAQPPASTVQPTFTKVDDLVGTGTIEVAKNDKVNVHYSGYLYNDSVTDKKGLRFDTSRTTGVPITVTMGENKVIAGWEQGLLGMKLGGKRTLIIPASLAYGSEVKGNIPANSALIFEVEITSITR